MAYHLDDTIVAIASPPGGAARGIVRLSGPKTVQCVARLFLSADSSHADHGAPLVEKYLNQLTRPTAISGNVHLSDFHSPLPADLYLWPNARSYTGQPVAELHTLGSPPLLDAVLRAACDADARLAEPGEFTLRAFLAGRIDLTQAEAVLGVIDATSQKQLDVALRQLAGGLSRPLVALRTRLLELLSLLEAGFDFPDENIAFITHDRLAQQLATARDDVTELSRQLESRHRTTEMPRAVLVGQPNAGKSSLFNALAEKDGAIVSHHPGTTRDYVSAEIDLDGLACELIDTAGVSREEEKTGGQQTIQQAAEQIARQERERADVQIHCVDASKCHGDLPEHFARCLGRSTAAVQQNDKSEFLVLTKVDLVEPSDAPVRLVERQEGLSVSSLTGQGLDALRARLRDAARQACSAPDQAVASTAARCGESLHEASQAIDRAAHLIHDGQGDELIATEIRLALDAIGRVAGTVHADDVLDLVFSRFCIGK